MLMTWTKKLLAASLGLGMCLGAAAVAQPPVTSTSMPCPCYTSTPHYQSGPVYAPHGCPCPIIIEPSKPTTVPDAGKPASEDGKPAAETTQPQDQNLNQAPVAPDAGLGTGMAGGPGGGTSSTAGMLGRADWNNRFNIFDTMGAAPMTRVWFNYQRIDKYHVSNFGYHNEGLASLQPQQALYRAGVEVALGRNISVAAQGQYVSYYGDNGLGDFWADPQFMIKYAFINQCDSIYSGVLAITPETSQSRDELRDHRTRLYPGFLFYQGLGLGNNCCNNCCNCCCPTPSDLFVQGGFQFGLPCSGGLDPYTFDFGVSVGYWLFRNDNGCNGGCGSCGQCCSCACQPKLLTAIIPQVEILGGHVLGTNRSDDLAGSGLTGLQPRNVLDVTVGVQFVLWNHVWIGGAYSRPITGAEIRENEFFGSIQYRF